MLVRQQGGLEGFEITHIGPQQKGYGVARIKSEGFIQIVEGFVRLVVIPG
jgi:hypothetical protein